MAKKNFKGTVKRCTPTRMKPKKNRKTDWNISGIREKKQFIEEDRKAEITVDLVLQASADNKVNGPEDAIVSEMVKNLTMEKSTLLRGASKKDSWAIWNPQVRGRW